MILRSLLMKFKCSPHVCVGFLQVLLMRLINSRLTEEMCILKWTGGISRVTQTCIFTYSINVDADDMNCS